MHHIVALYRINIHIYSEIAILVKFFYKKSGELIQWKQFTSIEISDASARYINISKLKIRGFLFLAGSATVYLVLNFIYI